MPFELDSQTFQAVKAGALAFSFIGAAICQAVSPIVRNSAAIRRNWRANIPLALISGVAVGAICGGCVCAIARAADTRGTGIFHWLGVSPAAQIVLSVLLLDLVAYVWHRANHRVPFLWRFHAVHHSDEVYDASTAARFHPGEVLISLIPRMLIVAVFGISLTSILTFEIIYSACNYFEHGNIRLYQPLDRFLRRCLVTPACHRLHHSQRADELNSNFGTIFSVWDRIFTTWHEPPATPVPVLGLPPSRGATSPFDLIALLRSPFLPRVAVAAADE